MTKEVAQIICENGTDDMFVMESNAAGGWSVGAPNLNDLFEAVAFTGYQGMMMGKRTEDEAIMATGAITNGCRIDQTDDAWLLS